MRSDADHVLSWLADRRERIVDELGEWVRIPSIAGAARYAADLDRSARWLAQRLRTVGFPDVEVWADDGAQPVVFADWPATGDAPVVLVYSHHDVRTAKAEQWRSGQPFAPELRGARLYGRGASDAKGQVLAHVWGIAACLAMGETGAPPVHVKLLVEGEEETGSPHLADVLRAHADQLRADLVVLSDTMTWAADRPAVCTGMRGMMAARLEIRAAQADVHGGAVAGAAVNPAHELARVVAGLHDATGRVSVPGFYDDVEEASDAERAALAQLTADENDWLRRVGVRALQGERGRSLGELLFTRPALEVRTLVSGDVQPPTTGTVSATAAADIQVSLVPRQDPGAVRKQLEAWFAQHVSRDVEFEFSVDETISQPAYVTPSDHPVLALIGEAMSQVWGCDVGRMRNAGGGPAAVLARASGAPVAFFGTGLPEDGWHGPDESVDLDVLLKGAATLALLWPRLAEQLPRRG